jgi:hypothetical protein
MSSTSKQMTAIARLVSLLFVIGTMGKVAFAVITGTMRTDWGILALLLTLGAGGLVYLGSGWLGRAAARGLD